MQTAIIIFGILSGLVVFFWPMPKKSKSTPELEKKMFDAIRIEDSAKLHAAVDAGADVNVADDFGFRPLQLAALNESVELGRFLLLNGADVNGTGRFGETALHVAAINGKRDFIEMLLCFKALLMSVKDKQGLTPLAWAEGKHSGMKADRKMIGLLRSNGAL